LIEFDDNKVRILGLKPTLDELGAALRLADADVELKGLEAESSRDEFWNDRENSQRVLQRI
jgi:hypothetical protein